MIHGQYFTQRTWGASFGGWSTKKQYLVYVVPCASSSQGRAWRTSLRSMHSKGIWYWISFYYRSLPACLGLLFALAKTIAWVPVQIFSDIQLYCSRTIADGLHFDLIAEIFWYGLGLAHCWDMRTRPAGRTAHAGKENVFSTQRSKIQFKACSTQILSFLPYYVACIPSQGSIYFFSLFKVRQSSKWHLLEKLTDSILQFQGHILHKVLSWLLNL